MSCTKSGACPENDLVTNSLGVLLLVRWHSLTIEPDLFFHLCQGLLPGYSGIFQDPLNAPGSEAATMTFQNTKSFQYEKGAEHVLATLSACYRKCNSS